VYAKYAFNWCIIHQVNSEVPSAAKSHGTRAGSKHRAAEVQPEWLAGGGGNFINVSLKVIIKGAKGTMVGFLPEHIHSTTRLCGMHKHGMTLAFSSQLTEAFKKAQQCDCCTGGREIQMHFRCRQGSWG
jgi:hypothetical protein